MAEADLQAEVERLRAENEKLKNEGVRGLSLKVSEKGDKTRVRIAGVVIVRQRPGTASGFIFMSRLCRAPATILK